MTLLTTKELAWLADNQSGLIAFERPAYTVIEGEFRFHFTHKDVAIKDTYDIRIELLHDGQRPRIREMAGRIKAVYEKHPKFKSPADIHAFTSWNLCIAAPQELTLIYLANPNIQILMERYIGPYFYSQSFFEKYDVWPWPHLRHGTNGIIDWFMQNQNLAGAADETAKELVKLAKKDNKSLAATVLKNARRPDSFNPRGRCLCGKRRNFARCHPGLYKLVRPLRRAAV